MSGGDDINGRCGAHTRSGGECSLPAGHGTDHVGAGPCARHGGHLPGPRKAAARELAMMRAREYGLEPDSDPFSAILTMVRRAKGANDLFLGRVAKMIAEDQEFSADHPDWQGYLITMRQSAQISDWAIKAGVAEREMRLAERLWDTITAAYEDALARVDWLDDAQRRELAVAFGGSLGEAEAEVVEGSESTT